MKIILDRSVMNPGYQMSYYRYQSMYLSQGNAIVTWQRNEWEGTGAASTNATTERNVVHILILEYLNAFISTRSY